MRPSTLSDADKKRLAAVVPRLAPYGWDVIALAMEKSKSACIHQWAKLVRDRDDLNDVEVVAGVHNKGADVEAVDALLAARKIDADDDAKAALLRWFRQKLDAACRGAVSSADFEKELQLLCACNSAFYEMCTDLKARYIEEGVNGAIQYYPGYPVLLRRSAVLEAVRRDATRREWDRRCWAGEGDDVGDRARVAKFEADRDALKKCVADGVFPEALLPQVLAAIAPCLKSRPTSWFATGGDKARQDQDCASSLDVIEGVLSEELGHSVRFGARVSLETFDTAADITELCGRDVFVALPLLPDLSGRTVVLCEYQGRVLAVFGKREATLNYCMESGRPANSPFDPGAEGNFPRFKTESRDDRGAYIDPRPPHRMCLAVLYLNAMALDPNVLGAPSLSPSVVGRAARHVHKGLKADRSAQPAPAPTALVGDGGSDDDDAASGAAVATMARKRGAPAVVAGSSDDDDENNAADDAPLEPDPLSAEFLKVFAAHHAATHGGDNKIDDLTRVWGSLRTTSPPHSPNEATAMALQIVFGVEKPRMPPTIDELPQSRRERFAETGYRPALKPDEEGVISFVRRVDSAVAASKAPPPPPPPPPRAAAAAPSPGGRSTRRSQKAAAVADEPTTEVEACPHCKTVTRGDFDTKRAFGAHVRTCPSNADRNMGGGRRMSKPAATAAQDAAMRAVSKLRDSGKGRGALTLEDVEKELAAAGKDSASYGIQNLQRVVDSAKNLVPVMELLGAAGYGIGGGCNKNKTSNGDETGNGLPPEQQAQGSDDEQPDRDAEPYRPTEDEEGRTPRAAWTAAKTVASAPVIVIPLKPRADQSVVDFAIYQGLVRKAILAGAAVPPFVDELPALGAPEPGDGGAKKRRVESVTDASPGAVVA